VPPRTGDQPFSLRPSYGETVRVWLLRSLLQRILNPKDRHERAAEASVRHPDDAEPRRSSSSAHATAGSRAARTARRPIGTALPRCTPCLPISQRPRLVD
jgi:hypothetical protein